MYIIIISLCKVLYMCIVDAHNGRRMLRRHLLLFFVVFSSSCSEKICIIAQESHTKYVSLQIGSGERIDRFYWSTLKRTHIDILV